MDWIPIVNATLDSCDSLADSDSCTIKQDERGKIDALAGLRLVVSCLSILGAVSIVFSAIRRRQVLSPRVHPIFVLSIADFMLAVLWLAGSAIWLGKTSGMRRGWCLSASLITIIMECVAINLTLVYAMLAYSSIKKQDMSENQVYQEQYTLGQQNRETAQESRVWHPCKTLTIYCVAWLLPLFLIMIPFTGIVTAGSYSILDHVLNCTCWCVPSFGNVIPFSGQATIVETLQYRYELRKILLVYGVVLSTHYLVVFVLLVISYIKILKRVKSIMLKHKQLNGTPRYGAVQTQMSQRQTHAKKRVVYFLAVFTITGFFNLILSLLFTIFEVRALIKENPELHNSIEVPKWLVPLMYVVFYCQSLTVPLQGFLNAMVYGWTRDEFLQAVTAKNNLEEPTERDFIVSNDNIPHDIIDVSFTVSRKSPSLTNGSTSVKTKHYRHANKVEALLDQQETELSDFEEELDTSNEFSIHKV